MIRWTNVIITNTVTPHGTVGRSQNEIRRYFGTRIHIRFLPGYIGTQYEIRYRPRGQPRRVKGTECVLGIGEILGMVRYWISTNDVISSNRAAGPFLLLSSAKLRCRASASNCHTAVVSRNLAGILFNNFAVIFEIVAIACNYRK